MPHIDVSRTQFITWRLADALPPGTYLRLKEEVALLASEEGKRHISRKIEAICDQAHGGCILRSPIHARLVQEVLFRGHGPSYALHAWVVMPNHVHVLLTPNEDISVAAVVRSLKASSSKEINRQSGKAGRIWQPDYFDRYIRSTDHFHKVLEYIQWNPVKAKLVEDPTLYPWSSANPAAWERLGCVVQSGQSRLV